MAKTNRDRIGEGLELLNKGLAPFVEREMKVFHKGKWEQIETQYFGDKKQNRNDPQITLTMMWDHWNNVFKKTLGHAERSLISEVRDIRNRWAHMEAFSTDDAYRALDTIGRLLNAVSAPEAAKLEKQKMELLRLRFEEQRRYDARRAAVAPVEGRPATNLKPWREVVTPHPDVASGGYQQAEFAADLWQVYLKEGSDEYKDPTEFFRRTFLTEGLKHLLTRAVQRLTGKGGDPVVELQTNFGGGKTHSMLALYHLFSGVSAADLAGIEDLLKDIDSKIPRKIHRAVIVGTRLSPGKAHKKPDGTTIRTMWGEIAWQLGGKEAYGIVKEADETATNPGDSLRELFNQYSPCLILIDEWVAFARQLHDNGGLPAGTFDTQFTFAQALTESAKAAKQTLVVVSIPASESPSPRDGRAVVSDIEVGGERGRIALTRLKNAIGRVEASWRPASPDEGFEIVRRRLFQPITEPSKFIDLDQVARAYVDMYAGQQQEFPSECREASYERRIKMAYPIHPELFDRLYNDWSTLDKFQRTRGVLRLMAAVIHSLWERQDNNLLIMPANVPVEDPRVQFELTRYLEDQWVPVIEKDVDGQLSLPLTLDRENPNLGRYSACRRVARTIYMGSAPVQRAANRGIDDRQVKLGCVQAGESAAIFGDALRRLTDRATYLYVDGRRYWYSTQPTVAKLAQDRATQVRDDDVYDEISRRLRNAARSRGEFGKVHACALSGDIPDERETRLVILSPERPHTAKEKASPALETSSDVLNSRGTSPRTYRNTLVFLAADSSRLRDLEQAVRQYIAWKSIWEDRETLNLDSFQTRQAETKSRGADETVDARIPEAYQWLLVPSQPDPKGSLEWLEIRQQGHEALAVRASKKLKNDELLMVQLGGARLRHELDRVPLWRGDNVGVRQLAEDFATYLYLPRLADDEVLLLAIRDGVSLLTWQSETFAYAERWDEQRKRYVGLQTGPGVRVLPDGQSLIVKPDVAAAQMEAESAEARTTTTVSERLGESGPGGESGGDSTGTTTVEPPPQYRRFHGSASLDPNRLSRDASRIAEEVVQHLTSLLGSNVEVNLEIHADVPDGVPDDTIRTVTENCRALKFKSHGFEQE
ncbi:MAG: ATP-binding protein [Candidatus Abyssobacteria bacterium SURF_5]|uniref:ATP-binding protein n=1 Tax=Abyssobacteria bacterium (strain SURF_5) TaxID=2093360 RepID=A0A3A4NZT7_ABYX5|nr:MAG: ATP-binding protein [Candidatus Abyssubacteria bacterium SURF_5]